MTNKSRQAASRYARRSGQGKKKQQPKSHPPLDAKVAPVQPRVQRVASQQTEKAQPKQAAETAPKTQDQVRASAVAATYSYIASDLKRTGIIAVAIFALLIALALIFG